MIKNFLITHPHLKPVNILNLYERLLKASNNTMLLLFNIYKDQYELHSISSFELNGESLNAVLEEDMLNGWLVHDYLANNIKKFGIEVESERALTNDLIDSTQDRGLELLTNRTLRTLETIVGREI